MTVRPPPEHTLTYGDHAAVFGVGKRAVTAEVKALLDICELDT